MAYDGSLTEIAAKVAATRRRLRLLALARAYLERVQGFIGAPIDMVSTGPDREHTILLRHPYQN